MGNGGWTNDTITTLVIPTGATTGARIVIDGTTGIITGYDANNNVVDVIEPQKMIIQAADGSQVMLRSDLGYAAVVMTAPGVNFSAGAIRSTSGGDTTVFGAATNGEVGGTTVWQCSSGGLNPTISENVHAGTYTVNADTYVFTTQDGVRTNSNQGLFIQSLGWPNFQVCAAKSLLNTTSVGVHTTTSATYVNMGVTGPALQKMYPQTQIRCTLMTSMYSTVASTGAMLGVNVNGVDYDVVPYFFNAASDHRSVSGIVEVGAGLAAGTAWTVQPRWKRVSGTGTLSQDTNDGLSLLIEEVY